MIFRFGICELDLGRVVLHRDGREIKLEPKVFDVLSYLVQHRGVVVRKEELLDELWGDRFVSESALTTRIKLVRQAVGDDGNRQEVIRTVHGRGYEFIADVTVIDDPVAAPAADDGSPVAGLPAAVQTLIGRESLLGSLVGALRAHRLITLVGPGGVGKTSVGLELARRVAANYPDGVHLIELVSVVDESATFDAFATAIDVSVRRRSSIDDAIIEMLRPRRCLLVLDNCEHLIDSVATLVSRILRETSSVAIIATSREQLAVPGEHVWAVDPLSTGGASLEVPELGDVPAVALFVERARAADPEFSLNATSAPIIAEICRRLDGIPLAIELAAARARAVDVAEIARRLDERFVLLKAMRRGSDPRHRTMHDAISWSYDLMAADEQRLFTALSVFAGPFDLSSAESMCAVGDTLDVLTRLSERSMLSVRRQADGGTRYELLETLREYGRRRISDERAVDLFTAHAHHFASEARSIQADLQTPNEPLAMTRGEGSFADLRAAQRFAVETADIDTAFGLISSIREFAMRAMRYEVFAWAEAACRAPGALDHPQAALMTGMRAYGAWVRGEFDLAISLAREARQREQALGVDPSGLVERVLANALYVMGQSDVGHIEGLRQVELAEQSGNSSRVVHACYMASVGLSSEGAYEAAADYVARARALALKTGSVTDLASAAVAKGFATHDDDDAALRAFLTADRLASSAGNRWMSGFARTEASGFLVHRGDIETGCAGLAEMVDLWYRAGEWSQQWHTLSRCLIALPLVGHRELAAELVGAVEAHAKLGVAPMSPTLRDVAFAARDALVGRLGASRFDELRVQGAASPVDVIVQRTRNALLGAARQRVTE